MMSFYGLQAVQEGLNIGQKGFYCEWLNMLQGGGGGCLLVGLLNLFQISAVVNPYRKIKHDLLCWDKCYLSESSYNSTLNPVNNHIIILFWSILIELI